MAEPEFDFISGVSKANLLVDILLKKSSPNPSLLKSEANILLYPGLAENSRYLQNPLIGIWADISERKRNIKNAKLIVFIRSRGKPGLSS